MIIPEYIQVAIDAIEEEDSFALEAEHQLVEWLEEVESGFNLNLLNNPVSVSESRSWSRSKSLSCSRFCSRSWSWSRSKPLTWSISGHMSLSLFESGSRSWSWSRSKPWSWSRSKSCSKFRSRHD
jgi:hypothetical protein